MRRGEREEGTNGGTGEHVYVLPMDIGKLIWH